MISAVALFCIAQTPAIPANWPFETAGLTPLGGRYRFTEGPTWVTKKAGGEFIFCDMSADTVYAWSGNVSDEPRKLMSPSGRAVGSAADKDGVVYQVVTAAREIGKWSLQADGTATARTTFAKDWDGKKLGGMNDLAVHPSGAVYVTHAEWFIDPLTKEVDHSGVIRIAPDGKVTDAAKEIVRPNGICFSPDGKTAYVTEFSAGRILKFTVGQGGAFTDKSEFANLAEMAKTQSIQGGGGADGIRTDAKGNVYSTGPGGVWVLTTDGKFIAHLPTRATNLAFGGADGKTLLVTTGGGVATIKAKTAGF